MACGLPAASTLVRGLADIVRDGENAMAVPPARLAGALRALLDDPRYRERLGSAARMLARKHHDVDVVSDAYRKLLSELVPQPGGRTP